MFPHHDHLVNRELARRLSHGPVSCLCWCMVAFLWVRFGVSAKIFAGYAVLLVVFAATSVFTLVYLHRARQQVLVNQHFFAVQSSVDESWRALG